MRVLLATALIAAVVSGAEIYYAQKPSDWRDVAADNAVDATATGKSNGNGNVNGKGNGGNGLHNGWNTGSIKDTGNVKEDSGSNNGKGSANSNGKGSGANGASSSNGNGNMNGNGNGGNGLHVGWKGDDGKDTSPGSKATGVSNGNSNGHSNGNGNVNGNGNGGNGNHLGWNNGAAKVVDDGKGNPGTGVSTGNGNGNSNGNGNVNGNGNGGNGNHNGWNKDDGKGTDSGTEKPSAGADKGNSNGNSNGNGNVNGNGNGGNGNHLGWNKDVVIVADNGKGNQGQSVGDSNANGHSNGNGNVNGNGNGGNGNHLGWSKDGATVVDSGKENPGQAVGNGNGHSNGNGNINGNGNGGNGNHLGWKGEDTKSADSGKETPAQGAGNGNGNGHSNGNGNVNGNGNGGNGNHLGWNKEDAKDSGKETPDQGVGNGNGNGNSNGNGNVNGKGNGGNGNHFGWNKDDTKVVDSGKENPGQVVGNGNGNGNSNGNGNVNGNGNGGNGNHLEWNKDETKVTDSGKENPGQGVSNGNGNGHSNGNGNVNGNGNGGNGNHLGWNKDSTNVADSGKENPGLGGKENPGHGVSNGNGNGHSNGNGNVNGNGNGGNGNHFGWNKDDTKVVDDGKGTTTSAATTKRPPIIVTQPSSTNPEIKVVSSTTAKPTSATPEKPTVAATTTKATPPAAEKSSTAAVSKATPPLAEKSSTAAVTKATPPPAQKSSTAAVTKAAVSPSKDDGGQDKWKGKDSGEKDKHNNNGQDKWKGHDSGEKDKHNGNGHDKLKGSTQQATTTRRPIITVRQPSTAEPAIKAVSSTTEKPTSPNAEKSTVAPATAKPTAQPAEKSSTPAVTKPAVKPPKDNSGQGKWKDHSGHRVDQPTGTRPAVLTDKPKQDFTEATVKTSTTRRPIFTIRLPSSTSRVDPLASSTSKPTTQTPDTPTAIPTTAKASVPPVEKTSPAASSKPAIQTASVKIPASVPTASPNTCNIYPTSPTATLRPIPPNLDSDSCTSNGYLHRLVLNSCCSLYMHQDLDGLMKLRECPTGTRFDVYSCSCRYSNEVTCFDRLPGLPTPAPPTDENPAEKIVPPVRIGDMCVSNKNVYRVVANSGCAKFTQQGEDSHVASHDCPAGTKFDLEVCTCRHAFEFQCSDKALDSRWTTPASAPSWPVNPHQRPTDPPIRIGDLCVGHGKAFGVVPRTGCTKFTQQTPDGRIFELQCPHGLKFDIDICVCRYESDFTCPDKTTSIYVTGRPAPIITEKPVSKMPPTRVGDECHYLGSVYRLVTRSGCVRFTQLGEDGRVHINECPSGLLFNLDSCSCSYAEDFQCSDKVDFVTQRFTDAPTSRVPQIVQGNKCIVGGNVYAVLPGTGCSRFTQEVVGARPYVQSCPPGLGFDLKACVCRYFDEEFSCSDKVNGHIIPTKPVPSPTIKIDYPRRVGDTCISAGNIYAVLPDSICSKFTQEVTGGQKFVHSCPPGLGFDLDVCVCRMYNDQFSCDGKVNVPVILTTKPSLAVVRTTQSTGRIGDACISHGSTYRLAPKEGCRWFTQTSSDGKMILHHCPDGLKFDLDVCVCRFASDFVCLEEDSNKLAPTTVAPKTTTIKATTALPRFGDSCFLNGVTYRLLPYCGCSRYTQRRPAFGGDDLSLHECSAGNLFDLDKCACRPSGTFACADPAPSNIVNQPVALPMRSTFVTTAAPTAAVSSRTCVAGGNIYRIIRHTSCRRFTQEAPGGRVIDNTCPGGLVFDMNICVCRYAHDVTCLEY